MVIVASIVLLTSDAPLLELKKCIGKDGKTFTVYLFRTGNNSTGKFLHKTGLDRLPQFINVIKGDMILIGPHPISSINVKEYKEHFSIRQSIKPGIISPQLLHGHDKEIFTRTQTDIAYVNQKYILTDLLLFKDACRLFWINFWHSLEDAFIHSDKKN